MGPIVWASCQVGLMYLLVALWDWVENGCKRWLARAAPGTVVDVDVDATANDDVYSW